ncbi:MAG: hypothetical protein ACYC0V_12045 [Armatimonadota bacterium]
MRLQPEPLSLLRDVVREQRPDLLPAVDRLDNGYPISLEDKRCLIDLAGNEIARTGFFETEGSVERGMMLEAIIDFLCDVRWEVETIYIQLLDEGTPTWRPTTGEKKREGVYRVLPTDNYDPEDETWEFLPGTIVRCEEMILHGPRNEPTLRMVAKEALGPR